MKKVIPENQPHPLLVNAVLALMVANLLNGVLVSAKETISSVKAIMTSMLFHHWIAHGLILAVFMLVLTVLFYKADLGEKLKAGDTCCVRYTLIGTIVGAGLILGFYILHGMSIL